MAPSRSAGSSAPFSKDERVLCFHHEMLYEAKILETRPAPNGQSWQYRIHYKGWKNTVSLFSLRWISDFLCSHGLPHAVRLASLPKVGRLPEGVKLTPENTY
jgi:hypothetical protein